MKILSIGIQNLNSLRLQTRIALNKEPIVTSGLFAITGDTGAGKSTILDAITLALYGKIHRNKDVKEVISFGAGECHAEVEFQVKEDIYLARWEISRARGKSDGKLQPPKRELSKWDKKKNEFIPIAEKIREVDEMVEAVTGLDYDRFSRSVVLSQGDFAAFLKAGEKERSDLLERITGTEIYSELSKAAFERHKLEKDKLDGLKKEQENLQILDKDELKELKQNHKALSKTGKTQKTAIDKNRKIIQWIQNIKKLESRKEKLNESAAQVAAKKEAAKIDFDRLELHQKTIPFHNKLEKTEDLQGQVNASDQTLSHLNNTGLQLIKKEENAKLSLDTLQSKLTLLKTDWTEKSIQIDTVIALDIEIKEKEAPLVKTKAAFENLKAQIQEKQVRSKELEDSLAIFNKDQKTTIDWLKNNAQLKSIVEDLPRIDQYYATLRIEYKKKEAGNTELKQLKKELEQVQKKKETLEKSISNAQQELNTILTEFKESVPENIIQSRSELLHKLSEDIDQLSHSNQNLQQLKILNDQYQGLLRELSDYESKLENLKQEELSVNMLVMTAMETVDALHEQLEYKQQIYEQQNLIANYEKDRSSLKDGQPCPLCFAKTHPFREKKFKTYINRASEELTQTKSQYELVYKNYRLLLNRQKDIELQIENLAGNEVKELSGQVQGQFSKIVQFEERITQIAPELAIEDFALARQSSISRKISGFEKQLDTLKKTRQKLIKLDASLGKQETQVKDQENQKSTLELDLVKLTEQHKLLAKQLEDAEQNFNEQATALNLVLKPYNKTFDIKTGKETKDYLESIKKDFESKQQQQAELKSKIDLANQEIKQLKIQLIDLEKNAEQQSADLENANKVLSELKEKRTTLFGTDDPAIFKTQSLANIDSTNTQVGDASTLWTNIKLELQTNTTQIKETQKQVDQNRNLLEKLSSTLLTAISKSGFENIDQLNAAILPEPEANKIQNQSEKLNAKILEIQQGLKTTNADLKKELAKKLSDEDAETIQIKLNELEEKYQEIQQNIGALNEKLNQNEQRKEESKKLLDTIENQRIEFNRWAKLNDVIGQADGKKFRVFAQGLTLKNLAMLANHHLQQLNGRYFIHKRSDEDLALEIIDTYQADNIRSMNTLSGGESFLVSLSLALGLSDLAGRNTSIKSLFIDEGFGTLDDSTLDLAISTLENLQSSGKTIGIISHVKELKERISTQVVIQKTGSGFSELEIIG